MFGITIHGASDDLVEVEGDAPGCDEYNDELVVLRLVAGNARTRVWVKYISPGVWSIATAPEDEGIPMVPVSIRGGIPRSEWEPRVLKGEAAVPPMDYTAVAEAEVDSVEYVGGESP